MEQTDQKEYINKFSKYEHKTKSIRRRKKKFYNSIREQMEFYFNDANLSRDKFLTHVMDENSFVPLEIFLKFNKIKNLTDSVKDIAKALSNSTLLEFSNDREKVRRKTKMPEIRNVDDKIIYIESLPLYADHDWVINVFSRYGKVVHVSLPRHKHSRKLKEFGFVEFQNETSVIKVLKVFKEFGGILCSESINPINSASLTSIKSFIEEKNKITKQNLFENEITNNLDEESKREECKFENKILKRKGDDDTEKNVDSAKKQKLDEERKALNYFQTAKEEENNESNIKRKKIRRHRKRKNIFKTNNESDFHELKVLAKKDWRQLRNKYLNMQGEKFKEFKKMECNRLSNREVSKVGLKSKTNFCCITKPLENDNYLGSTNEKLENKYENGLIIRVEFFKPCVDVKSFKSDMKQYSCVKYVDVEENSYQSFIRCDTALNAENFIKQISCAEYKCQILMGDNERQYWEKIKRDRQKKLNKQIKIKQRCGRKKIMKTLSKYFNFSVE